MILVQNCSDLKILVHGAIAKQWNPVEDVVIAFYRCDKGYNIKGKSDRVCVNGEWNTAEPICGTYQGNIQDFYERLPTFTKCFFFKKQTKS